LTFLLAGALESTGNINALELDVSAWSGCLAYVSMQMNPRGKAAGRDLLIGIKSAVTQVDFE
jgi:hypothetical protein